MPPQGLPPDDHIPQFGQAVPGVNYVDRPSAYAVIFRRDRRVAVVSTPRGVFLPGGGQEAGEAPDETAVRESMEECGLPIRPSRELGAADQLVFTPGHATGLRKRCTFFAAEVDTVACGRREADHVLLWLTPGEAAQQLSYASHRWAVAKAAA